jgi:glutamate--cysteine ligase
VPGLSNSEYFGLIRNFRRHAFVPLVLFGASPAVCGGFVSGRTHELLPIAGTPCHTMHLPHATTLRMGRLGYQSDAQSRLAVSYNSLEGYADSLHGALSEPYPLYEHVGVRNPGGDYNQLATSLLQIENEFYGLIRPKRAIRSGERPLHALRERGVEYVEVRCMDLNPFHPVGIDARTMHFLDVFLLHCLLSSSPPDTPEEIGALGRNQHRTAARGREPGLLLERDEDVIGLSDWAREILRRCEPIAEAMDAAFGGDSHREAVQWAQDGIADMDRLPSAQVLGDMHRDFGGSYTAFGLARSEATRAAIMGLDWTAADAAHFAQLAEASRQKQRAIEEADELPFEEWRQIYVSPEGLTVQPA